MKYGRRKSTTPAEVRRQDDTCGERGVRIMPMHRAVREVIPVKYIFRGLLIAKVFLTHKNIKLSVANEQK